jgi:hypothetical protein
VDTATVAPARSRWIPIQFASLALVWGGSFLFIKVGLHGLSALQVAAARLDFGALTLISLMVLLRVRCRASSKSGDISRWSR